MTKNLVGLDLRKNWLKMFQYYHVSMSLSVQP